MLLRVLEFRAGREFPPSLRCILLGGGPIASSLVRACVSLGAPIAPTWGMTETASQAATLRPDEVSAHAGSAGRALIGVDIHIDAPAHLEREPGEIVVSGPSVMSRYLGPNAGSPNPGMHPFRTGDLGMLSEDGYLTVSDRRHDLIVTGGENVFPSEVESVLLEHPVISDAGVVGIPDEEWGQRIVAAIVPRASIGVESDLDAFCRSRLPSFKCPAGICEGSRIASNGIWQAPARRPRAHALGAGMIRSHSRPLDNRKASAF